MILSSGEVSLSDKMAETGERAKAGQAVRLIDLPADVEGLFESTEIGWTDIRNMVISEASRHLDANLADVKRRAAERVNESDRDQRHGPRLRSGPCLAH